jgi:hypothetical protein
LAEKRRNVIILSNKELYDAVRATISKLEVVGMKAAAKELQDALSISSMPGEILGETRLVLQKIENEPVSEDISYEISSEITYINSVLR